MVLFLEDERKERDAYVLNEKVRKSIKLSDKPDDKMDVKDKKEKPQDGKKVDIFQNLSDFEKCKCYICGKQGDHVLSFDSEKNPLIEYMVCKIFTDMTAKDRNKLIFKKHYCAKCLKPGIKWNSDHVCDRQFICNQRYKKGDNELKCENHVLVCGFHCQEKVIKIYWKYINLKLLKLMGSFSILPEMYL